MSPPTRNNSNSYNGAGHNPGKMGSSVTSMQLYRETDLRFQCSQITANENKKPTMSREQGSWSLNGNKKPAMKTDQGSWSLNVMSSWSGIRRYSSLSETESLNESISCTPAGKTIAQKVEIIVNNELQWRKLQQSLRDAGGLWTSMSVQQVLHAHVQQRIDELEQLEQMDSAVREQNRIPSPPMPRDEIEMVGTIRNFARKASVYMVSHSGGSNMEKSLPNFGTRRGTADSGSSFNEKQLPNFASRRGTGDSGGSNYEKLPTFASRRGTAAHVFLASTEEELLTY